MAKIFTAVPLRNGTLPKDWMTVSWVSRGGNSYGKLPIDVRELNELARESDRFRSDVREFVVFFFRCTCGWQVESHGNIHERSGWRSSRRVCQEVHGRVREAWHQALHLCLAIEPRAQTPSHTCLQDQHVRAHRHH